MKGRIGESEEYWRLVFSPISMCFSTHVAKIFYEALAARLNEAMHGELKPPAERTDPAAHYEPMSRTAHNSGHTEVACELGRFGAI
jgi:hypothetical protein